MPWEFLQTFSIIWVPDAGLQIGSLRLQLGADGVLDAVYTCTPGALMAYISIAFEVGVIYGDECKPSERKLTIRGLTYWNAGLAVRH